MSGVWYGSPVVAGGGAWPVLSDPGLGLRMCWSPSKCAWCLKLEAK